MKAARPGRPSNSERPDRVSDITDAAIKQFGEQGYSATTLSAIARSAGMTPAALYRYFDDKESLYLRAARVARERTWSWIAERFAPTGSLVADFEALTEMLVTIREPEVNEGLRLLASVQVTAVHHPELAPLLDERWQVRHTLVGDLGRRAYASGELTGFDDAEDAALAVEIIFSGLSTEMYAHRGMRGALAGAAIRAIRGLVGTSHVPG